MQRLLEEDGAPVLPSLRASAPSAAPRATECSGLRAPLTTRAHAEIGDRTPLRESSDAVSPLARGIGAGVGSTTALEKRGQWPGGREQDIGGLDCAPRAALLQPVRVTHPCSANSRTAHADHHRCVRRQPVPKPGLRDAGRRSGCPVCRPRAVPFRCCARNYSSGAIRTACACTCWCQPGLANNTQRRRAAPVMVGDHRVRMSRPLRSATMRAHAATCCRPD